MRWPRLLGPVFALGCGPIPAPPGAVDLSAEPAAFRTAFDAQVGTPRLVLLLSPG